MHLTKSFLFPRRYSGLSSGYKRPIVTSYLAFKIATVMENSSEFGSPNRLAAKGPDFKWVLAAQAGYALAFEGLVARNESRIYRLALNITRDQKDAENVLQSTFIRAYEHLREFRENSGFSKWFLRIRANEVLEKVRERHAEEIGRASVGK